MWQPPDLTGTVVLGGAVPRSEADLLPWDEKCTLVRALVR